MTKTRRTFIVLGTLLLLGDYSVVVGAREWISIRDGMFVILYTADGGWAFCVFRQPQFVRPDPATLNLGFMSIGVRLGDGWRINILGNFFACAAIILIPAIIFEIRAIRRRHGAASGFPIQPMKNPAHADGV